MADAVREESIGTSLSDVGDMLLGQSENSSNQNSSKAISSTGNCESAGMSYRNRINGSPGCQPCAQCAQLALMLCAYDDAIQRNDQNAKSIWMQRARIVKSVILGYEKTECPELTGKVR